MASGSEPDPDSPILLRNGALAHKLARNSKEPAVSVAKPCSPGTRECAKDAIPHASSKFVRDDYLGHTMNRKFKQPLQRNKTVGSVGEN